MKRMTAATSECLVHSIRKRPRSGASIVDNCRDRKPDTEPYRHSALETDTAQRYGATTTRHARDDRSQSVAPSTRTESRDNHHQLVAQQR